MEFYVRMAKLEDIPAITRIYNQGIEEKTATLETRIRSEEEMENWLLSRSDRHKVIVAVDEAGNVHGWASLNVFNARECYRGVADLSIYIDRASRGKGLGKMLLNSLSEVAKDQGFHKQVLNVFSTNEAAKALYKSVGFREVGTYMKQGMIDEKWIDITVMEKLLT